MRIIRLFCALIVVCAPLQAMEIIAHRGASKDAPENTLAALNLGWQQGAEAGELDVHLSKDGQLVLMHDATTKRTAGVDKPVVEQTLEELRALDAGAWKGEKWKGEKIPTLAEALATIPDGKRMFIEIKCGPEALPELERVIQASGKKPEQLAIICFNAEVVRLAKKKMPNIEAAWLASPGKEKVATAEELIAKAQTIKADGLDLNYNFPIDAAFVQKIKAANLKLYVWTVDDAAIAKKMAAAGVDGITTNRPAWLREQLK
jgi:glycerophosphoryl diester phosphodiesterase